MGGELTMIFQSHQLFKEYKVYNTIAFAPAGIYTTHNTFNQKLLNTKLISNTMFKYFNNEEKIKYFATAML